MGVGGHDLDMKRDMDLIRSLLLEIEEKDGGTGASISITNSENSKEQITEHLFLLKGAELIEAVDASHLSGRGVIVRRLTWHGHDFLDSVRDEEVWKFTKNGAAAAGGFTVDLLKAIAKGYLKKKIKDQTGIDI